MDYKLLPRDETGRVLVLGRGPVDSPFVIVGEGPGGEEVKTGEPFMGPSGSVLMAALQQMPKGSYPEPYFTNVSKIRLGTDKNPNILAKVAADNREALLAEIGAHPRKIVLAMGGVAMMALLGDYNFKITKHRGQFYNAHYSEHGILASLHPAYLLRGSGSFRQFKADVRYAMQLAAGFPKRPYAPPTYAAMTSPDDVAAFIEQCAALPDGSIIAGDLETSGFSFRMDRILCGGFSIDGKHVHTFWHNKTGVPRNWDMLEELRPLFRLKNLRFTWHNGKFDVKFLQEAGMEARVDEDTMLMSYALDETRGIHDLETVAADWLNSPVWKNILDSHKKKKASYDVIPPDILEKYMAFDIANTFNLAPVMLPIIDADKISKRQYRETLIPASTYLADVETHGLPVDPVRVTANAKVIGGQATALANELKAMANERSPGRYTEKMHNSPKQLKEFLYEDLGIPASDKGTGDDLLEKLPQYDMAVPAQKAVKLLRDYRKVAKQYSTYIKPYIRTWDDGGSVAKDGRVHSTYLIHGTATGRLSSRDPNLQNIPRDPTIKGQFQAFPGRVFIEVDLNQAELRSLACLSRDTALCGIYLDPNSTGLHEVVRAEVYGNPSDWSAKDLQHYLDKWFLTPDTRYVRDENGKILSDRILKEQKMRAKNVNFGIIYGITKYGLAEQIEDTPSEAQRMLETWAKKFPEAWHFIQLCRNAPLFNKNLVTPFGYRKRFGIVTESNLIATQNEAANMPHQSTAASITLHGGIRSYEELRGLDVKIVNTVHDSNLLDAPMDPIIIDKASRIVQRHMEQVPIDYGITTIPFVAEREVGTRWGAPQSFEEFYAEHGWELPT